MEHRRVNARRPQTWLQSASNFAKTRFRQSPSIQFSAKKVSFAENFPSPTSFFTFLVQFWRIHRQADLKIKSLAIFRSRWTYSEVCTTKARRKYVHQSHTALCLAGWGQPRDPHPATSIWRRRKFSSSIFFDFWRRCAARRQKSEKMQKLFIFLIQGGFNNH